jgi:peptidoglycan/LPS O-acetylase OafA/YrhL
MVRKLFSEIKSIPEPLQASHFPGLDGLRGIAILCVIFSHALLDKGMNFFCYALGMIGVQTFFVISGFLITTLLLKEKVSKGKVSIKDFYIRRFLRLAPVAYLYLFVVAILTYIFKLDLSLGSYLSAGLYVKNLPIVHDHDRLVGHFWTLAIEEQFYIIFPILLIYRPNKYLIVIILLMLFIPVLQYLGFNKIGVFYSNRFIHILTFIIINLFGNGTFAILSGSLLSLLIFKGILDVKKIKSNYLLSFVIFMIAAAFRAVRVSLLCTACEPGTN